MSSVALAGNVASAAALRARSEELFSEPPDIRTYLKLS